MESQNTIGHTAWLATRSLGTRWGVLGLLFFALGTNPELMAEESSPEPVSPTAEAQTEGAAGARKFRRRQGRPISLGTSGGNVNDFVVEGEFITCCSGTLGALVEKNDALYVLSNNHVLAVSNEGVAGDEVGQPGMLETRCQTPAADTVAHLSQYKKLKFGPAKRNRVDAALAEIVEGAVKTNGKILRIGIPGDSAIAPEIGMEVRKSGRTTGHTRGVIQEVNVTIEVGFPTVCGGEDFRTARFTKQFVVVGTSRDFSDGGDSGSVIYEDVKDCPHAVGLLFAGGGPFTFANPMQKVLKVMAKRRPRGPVRLVGCSSSATASAERGVRSRRELLLEAAMASQERNEERLLDLPGVVGMGIGRTPEPAGELVFRVYLAAMDETMLERVPSEVEGFRVELVETGPIVAY